MFAKPKNPKKKFNILRFLLLLFVGIFAGLNLYLWNANSVVGNAMPMPFGYGMAVVLSGSMEPELSVDDVIIIKDTGDYQVGDTVVYQSGTVPVVHQIISIDGETVVTQGIANNVADDPISMEIIKGELVGVIPGAGGVIRAVKTPAGVIIILAIAFVLLELSYRGEKKKDSADLERIKEEIRRLKAQKDAEAAAETAEEPQTPAEE